MAILTKSQPRRLRLSAPSVSAEDTARSTLEAFPCAKIAASAAPATTAAR